ncbi:hypothetical protein [Pilimelia columellifera]|uniref:Uncharacterized protein n=1 Tax=Pilimelia columellifera subsp. columellifera TaxID=706583 RepID=A0ABP6AI82_9ACTN
MHRNLFLSGATARVLAAVATGAVAITTMPAAALAADVDIRMLGGNGNASVVCGNVATAVQLAQQKRLKLQHSRCTADASGGTVTLENVDIYVSAAAQAANRNNPVLNALEEGPQRDKDHCATRRSAQSGAGHQLNICSASAVGGRVLLEAVRQVHRDRNGQTSTRQIDRLEIAPSAFGVGDADCKNIISDPRDQRDDCLGEASGALMNLRGVDAVVRSAGAPNVVRKGITIDLRGGTATNYVYCFNVADGAGHVRQINQCSAKSRGGDVVLKNVNIHTQS